MPAETLEDAYNALDPRRPITPEQVDRLFVTRPSSPVRKIEAQLELSDSRLKLLFVGHRGSGKSSEMAYLSTLLEANFLSVPVPLYDIFKSPAVSHTEVIFAMTLRLLVLATGEAVVARGVLNNVWEHFLEESYITLKRLIFGDAHIEADRQQTVTLKLNVLAAELETKIGTESFTRSQVKEKFEGRVVDLLEQIDRVTHLLEEKIGRNLILIVEDLDKFDPADTRRLFLDHARTLTAPHPSIIYSFPVAMRYDNDFKEIEQGFDDVHMLPNVALKHRDGLPDDTGWETMVRICQRRVAPELFAEGVTDRAIALSGGHVKSFIQLMQQAVLNAVVDEAEIVQLSNLKEAQRAMRDDYIVLLRREQIRLLRLLRDDPDKDLVDITPEKQALLSNGSLLEYADERGPWADVNPVVLELLDRDWA